MIRLCRPQTDVNSDAVLDRIRRLEQELTELRRTGVSIAPEEEVVAEAPEEALPQALPEDLQAVLDNWESIIRPLTQPMYMCVQNCRKSIGEGGRLLLLMRSEVDYGVMTTLGRTEQLEGVIEKTIHRAVKVEVKLLKQGDSTKRYVDLDEINRRLKKMKIQEESE